MADDSDHVKKTAMSRRQRRLTSAMSSVHLNRVSVGTWQSGVADKYYHGGQVGVTVLPTSLDLVQVQVMYFQSMCVQ